MRLFSQDGTIDVPYERVTVVVTGNYIGAEIDSKRYPMATYSSYGKAEKVMENLKYAYLIHQTYRMNGNNNANIPDEFYEVMHGVFQFPADDEVEV